jgi:hypothetical protein
MQGQKSDTPPLIKKTPRKRPRSLDFLNHVDRSDNPFFDMLEGFPVTDSEGRES